MGNVVDVQATYSQSRDKGQGKRIKEQIGNIDLKTVHRRSNIVNRKAENMKPEKLF